MFYKIAVILTAPFWMPAIVIGAICDSVVVGFLGGYYHMQQDSEKMKGTS